MQWIDQLPHEKSPLETVRVFQDGSYVFTQTKGDIGVNQEKAARIPSWLEVAPSLHSEAAYIEADHFFHQKILLAIRRRTIHSDPTLPGLSAAVTRFTRETRSMGRWIRWDDETRCVNRP